MDKWLDRISTEGYRTNSPDKGKSQLTIPGGNISMRNVPHNVMAIPDMGIPVLMQPGQDYHFPQATHVRELPMKQFGGPQYSYQRLPQPAQGMDGQYTQEQLNNEMGKAYRDTYGTQSGFDAPISTPTGFNQSPTGTSAPGEQSMTQQQPQSVTSHTDENADYSIDSVRQQAKYGGSVNKWLDNYK